MILHAIFGIPTELAVGILLVLAVLGAVCFGSLQRRKFTHSASERRKLLEKVKAAESKYREIFDNAVEGIFQSTVDGCYITANRSLARIFGYDTPEDLIKSVSRISETLYVDPVARESLVRQVDAQGVLSSFECEMFRKDGRTIWVRQSVRAVRDGQGKLQYLEGSLMDITGEHWAERRRILQLATAKALAESATVAQARPMILESICEILEWDLGAVWDVDAEHRSLHCVEVWHRPEINIDAFDDAVNRTFLSCGEGLAGKVWQRGEPEWVMDLQRRSGCHGYVEEAARSGMRSAFCIPIKVSDEVVHVLEFFSPRMSQPDPELMHLLEVINSRLGYLIGRKQAEEALRHSEARKTAILESALDCIITFDHDGRVMEFNPAAERTFGYSREDVKGRDIAELIFPKRLRDAHRRALSMQTTSDGGMRIGKQIELVAMRSDESELPIELSVSRIDVEEGSMFTAYIRNITERKRGDRVRSELAAVVESSNDAIAGMTLSGILVSWNASAERIYGYTAEEAIGRHVYMLFPRERMDELPATLAAAQRGESRPSVETERLRKDGRKIAVSITDSPIFGENGSITGVSSIARDVTEHRRLEEQFRQSQKMEAVGRLAGGVAHDFNNVLTAILGYSDLLLAQLEEDHAMRPQLAEIRRSAEFAATLTNQLLAVSRRQTLDPKIIDLNEVVGHMHNMLKRLIGADIHIVMVLEESIGMVKADPGQIEQVVLNLVVNARDAMPSGGVLTIQTSNELVLEECFVGDTELPAGDYVRLSVRDTGTGIPDGLRKHIFEPFFTSKEKGKGTGLGLATCYGIVRQSGGYITLETEEGIGTTFHINLPRISTQSSYHEERDEFRSLPQGHERILIVEDEVTVRCLTSAILRRLGYAVLEAVDGEEAREVISKERHNLDLVVADVVLPNSSGPELKKWIDDSGGNLKVLFTSGYVDEVVRNLNGLDCNEPFLQKPFTPADLSRKVRQVLEGTGCPVG